MVKNAQKLFALFCILALSMVSLMGISASGTNADESTDASALDPNYQCVLLYDQVQEMLAHENSSVSTCSEGSSSSGYAGAFIDAQDTFHVLLTEEASPAFAQQIQSLDDTIVLEQAVYSYDALSQNIELLRSSEEVLNTAGVYSTYIDEPSNCIMVYLTDASAEHLNAIRSIEGLDAEMLTFVEEPNQGSRFSATSASAGS